MADDIELEIAIAEQEALAKSRGLFSAPPSLPPAPSSFLDDFSTGLSAIGGGVSDAVTNFAGRTVGAASQFGSDVSDTFGGGQGPTSVEDLLLRLFATKSLPKLEQMGQQSVPQSISDVASTTIGAVPWAGPPLAAGIETAADVSDEYRGFAPETSNADKLRKFADITASGVGPDMAIRAGVKSLNALPDTVQNLGRNKKIALSEQANQIGASAAVQDAPKGTTAMERQIVEDIKPHESRFFEKGIAEGIDVSKQNRSKSFQQYQDKLGAFKEEALTTKTGILQEADGVLGGPGLSMSDVPMKKVTPELREAFSDPILDPYTGQPTGSRSKQLTLDQAQEHVRKLDAELRELGVYDANPQAKAMQNPSDLAKIKAKTEALREVRTNLNKAIIEKTGKVLGPEKQAALEAANADVSMAIEYEDLGQRFGNQSLEGLTPASARSLTNPGTGGWLKQTANIVMDKLAPHRKSAAVMERGRGAVEQLQQLGEYYRGEKPKVYSRDIGVPSGASELATLAGTAGAQGSFPNARAAVDATSMIPALQQLAGAFSPAEAQAQQPPPQFPRSSQAIQQNPQAFMQAVAQISGGNPELMQDVQAVLSEPNEAKRDMAMMELTKMLPQLFEPTAYKSLWNGRIADPAEQKMYGDELRTKHRGKQLDANYLAQSLSALNADGTMLPPPAPIMPQVEYPVSMPTSSLDKPREYSY